MNHLYRKYKEYMSFIGNVIGYGQDPKSPVNLLRNTKWELIDNELRYYDEKGYEYFYYVSSYKNLREKLYIGEYKSYTYIMAYCDNYYETEILILKTSNKI